MIPVTVAFPPRLIPAENQGAVTTFNLSDLTSALARGDDDAWLQFHDLYGPAIFRQLLALTRGDYDLAKDALQQTYLRVAKYVRCCETETMFKTWLRTVAQSALRDCWRRRRSFADLLFRKWQEPPELSDPATDNQLMERLDCALTRLDASDRLLLEWKYFLGLDVRSLAENLAITPKAVESRLVRARASLRHELLTALQNDE